MTSESNRTGGMHSQDATPTNSLNDPHAVDTPLPDGRQSAVPGGPFSDDYDADPLMADPLMGDPVMPVVPPASGSDSGSGSGSSGGQKDAAKHEAGQVKREGVEAGKKVAGTAKDEAGHVADQAKSKARGLASELGDDVRGQAQTQQQRLADGLRSVSKELGSMAENSEEEGMATNLVRQAASRSDAAAEWLGDRDPGSLLDEVKSFARRRPGTFLAIAAGAGLLAGRLSRGVAADTDEMEREDRGESVRNRPNAQSSYGAGHTGIETPRDMRPPAAPPLPPAGTAAPVIPAPGTTAPAVGEPGRRDYP